MFRRFRIAPRMTLLILIGTGVVLVAVSISDYYAARHLLEDELRGRARHLALATAREMEVIKRAVEKVVSEMVVAFLSRPYEEDQIYALLENTVREHDEIFGSAVVLHGEAAGLGREEVTIPYVYRDGEDLVRKDLASNDYPFETFDWYSIPKLLERPIWTEPYFDEGGGDFLMVTYSVPVFTGPEKTFAGIVTGDMSLEWLEATIAKMELGSGGYAFLVSRNGAFVSHPEKDLIMRESIFSLAEQFEDAEIRAVGQRMTSGETGFVAFRGLRYDVDFWLAYAPVLDTGWSLGALFPQREISAKLLDLSRLKFLLGAVGALAMVAVALLIARSISKPIQDLEAAARVLASGNLDAPLPTPRGKDEIARLTESFSRMRRDLKEHIEELKVTTAAKARMENDLETARTIQLDLLPSRFSFDPPKREVEIHAFLEAARAVGGDFYDFFSDGAGRLFIAVGDVSGKGVPAALFMAVSKAYLKAFATGLTDPAEALCQLNDELALENDEGMFLTVFCAWIDLNTGECRYASGGHNPPFVVRQSGVVEEVPAPKGPLIGLDSPKSFESASLRLERGDVLVVFSDGVVEAEDSTQSFYGEERTGAALARLTGKAAREVVDGLRADLHAFVGAAPQSDDITVLAIRYLGHA